MTRNNSKFCLTKDYRISCPFLGSYPEFFQGNSTDSQGLIFKLCLVLLSLLQCYTPALLPCGKPGPHTRRKVYENTNQYIHIFLKDITQKIILPALEMQVKKPIKQKQNKEVLFFFKWV